MRQTINDNCYGLIFLLQNARKFTSEHLVKKFRGSMPPVPPSNTSSLRRSCCTPLACRDVSVTLENLPAENISWVDTYVIVN